MLLEPHKKQAGAVSALSGSIQMCMAGLLGGYFLAESWVTTHLQLGVFYLIIGAGMGLYCGLQLELTKNSDSAAIEYS